MAEPKKIDPPQGIVPKPLLDKYGQPKWHPRYGASGVTLLDPESLRPSAGPAAGTKDPYMMLAPGIVRQMRAEDAAELLVQPPQFSAFPYRLATDDEILAYRGSSKK